MIYKDKYISNIKIDGNYYEEIEIIAASKLFHLSIYVLEKTENLNGYRFLYKYLNEGNYVFFFNTKSYI